MRKNFKLMMIVTVALVTAITSTAQNPRVVAISGYDPAIGGQIFLYQDVVSNTIEGDTTATGERVDPNTIYELKRDHLYPQGKIIENYGYHLHIRAEEGDGRLPEFIPGLNPSGSYGYTYIRAYDDLTIQNLVFNGFQPDGGNMHHMVQFRGHKSRIVVEGCVWDGDNSSALYFVGDSLRVFAKDLKVINCGHHKDVNGNGNMIEFRDVYVDTLVLLNSTFTNATDRVIRNRGAEVNYLEIDHLTALNTAGYSGAIQLGFVHTAKITNSIFANTISLGYEDVRAYELTNPENHLAVIALDTTFDGQVIEIRNNNIYWDQELVDVWSRYDIVSQPWYLTPTVEAALDGTIADSYFSEALTFTTSCGPITSYVDAYYMDHFTNEYPENWCIGGEGGYFYDQLDLTYLTDAVSYTDGDDGFPLGDLNYWPEYKELYEALNTQILYSSACDSYTSMSGKIWTESNIYKDTIADPAGNDHIITIDLTVNNSNAGIETITACDIYKWIDGVTYTENNNTATHTLTNVAGCDSLVSLHLTINRSKSSTDIITACDSYTWINGVTYTGSNNYAFDALPASNGCDSIVFLDLTINKSKSSTDVITACDSYTWINGVTYTESNNNATHKLIAKNGCDSTINLNLTINKSFLSNISVDHSIGETYTAPDGQTYTTAGTYQADLQSIYGCDSIIIVTLDFLSDIANQHINAIHSIPNPMRDELIIDLGREYASINVRIINQIGQTLYIYNENKSKRLTYNVSGLTSGPYLIELLLDSELKYIKVLKE